MSLTAFANGEKLPPGVPPKIVTDARVAYVDTAVAWGASCVSTVMSGF